MSINDVTCKQDMHVACDSKDCVSFKRFIPLTILSFQQQQQQISGSLLGSLPLFVFLAKGCFVGHRSLWQLNGTSSCDGQIDFEKQKRYCCFVVSSFYKLGFYFCFFFVVSLSCKISENMAFSNKLDCLEIRKILVCVTNVPAYHYKITFVL